MTLQSPPAYLQGGTYTAVSDRLHLNTIRSIRDASDTFRGLQGFMPDRYPAYSNPSAMNWSVGPCAGIITNTFVSGGGEYMFANPTNVTGSFAASSPTLNRYDILGFRVQDNFYDSSGFNQVVPAVIQGANSAGTPVDPALPSSFIPILRAVINAAATTPVLQDLRFPAGLSGSVLPVSSQTQRTALGAVHAGFTIYRTDRNWVEIYDGTGWRVQGVASCSSEADRDSVITTPYNGQLATTTDTGTLWQRQAGAWRPAGPLGVIGGRVISGLNTLTSGIGATETMPTNMNSGTVALLPNRRYRVVCRFKMQATVDFDNFTCRIREATTAGTGGNQLRQHVQNTFTSAFGYTHDTSADYETGGSAVNRIFSFTAQRSGGGAVTASFLGGDTGTTNLVGVWVEDRGPAGKLTVTPS